METRNIRVPFGTLFSGFPASRVCRPIVWCSVGIVCDGVGNSPNKMCWANNRRMIVTFLLCMCVCVYVCVVCCTLMHYGTILRTVLRGFVPGRD